jgi:hypothetical protein
MIPRYLFLTGVSHYVGTNSSHHDAYIDAGIGEVFDECFGKRTVSAFAA